MTDCSIPPLDHGVIGNGPVLAWAEALALISRVDEAVTVFDRVLGYAHGVGLFSEDIDPASGRLLGNFPQADTHVGLIHAAATTIGGLLAARDTRSRVWP